MSRFCFVVPMFNAASTLSRMLCSVVGQSHQSWKIVLIDDVSDAHQAAQCDEIVAQFRRLIAITNNECEIVTMKNAEKRWEVANVLTGLLECEPDDIVCRLDADDWLVDLDALTMIDCVYERTECDVLWTAHRWGFSDKNISGPMSPGLDPYSHPWVSSHMKTFRRRLIDDVPFENFTNADESVIRRAGDQAIYLPVLRAASKRLFLPRVTYHYTIDDRPETYRTQDAIFQKMEAEHIRRRGYVDAGRSWETVIREMNNEKILPASSV